MKEPDPAKRPSAEAALAKFQEVQAGVTGVTLRWRLRPRMESTPERVVYDAMAVVREGYHQIKRFVG